MIPVEKTKTMNKLIFSKNNGKTKSKQCTENKLNFTA